MSHRQKLEPFVLESIHYRGVDAVRGLRDA